MVTLATHFNQAKTTIMKKIIISIALLGTLSSCDKTEPTDITSMSQAVVENYAANALASYEDAVSTAKVLQTKVNSFLENPSEQGLADCKAAWIASRVPYLQTEAFRFYGGPIDEETNNFERLINAWPLNEVFIDYVVSENKQDSVIYGGVINDVANYPVISKEVLLGDNGKNGENDVKVGYHAVEFLLWGQDLYADGPGKRPYTDYLEGGTAKNQKRRGQYLKVVVDLLVEDLNAVKSQWETGGAYRTDFTAPANVTQSLTNMLNGMGKLTKGELSGARMAVLLASKAQEDEHSCFSDNTNNDYKYDEAGIYNVYLGKYTRVDGTVLDGPGIDDLVKAKIAGINLSSIARFDAAVAVINALPVPIDQGVIKNEAAFKKAINALRDQADQLVISADAIGIKLNIPERNQ